MTPPPETPGQRPDDRDLDSLEDADLVEGPAPAEDSSVPPPEEDEDPAALVPSEAGGEPTDADALPAPRA
jgi:hypothetical protein